MARRRGPSREEPSDDGCDRGPAADPEGVARTIVLNRLTTRARSRSELADALREREVPDDVAARVLDRFTELGLVDDTAFAKAWVDSRQATRSLSRRALSSELYRKGVDSEIVADALADIDDDSEYAAARQLVLKKLRSSRTLDERAQWRQLVGLLARRGYSSAVAMRVVADAMRGDGSDDDDQDARAASRSR